MEEKQRKLLRVEEVVALIRRSRSSIARDVASGAFPAPLRIGRRAMAWREEDVFAWMDSRPRSRVTSTDTQK